MDFLIHIENMGIETGPTTFCALDSLLLQIFLNFKLKFLDLKRSLYDK